MDVRLNIPRPARLPLQRTTPPSPGFTLIELMVVLVIVGVLLAVAVPSFSVLSLRTKLKAYSNDMVASMYLARGEAIKRNAPMTLCISTNPPLTDPPTPPTCAGGGNWDQGWIVMDPDGDVKKWQRSVTSEIKIFELSSVHTMTFQPSGVLSTPATMTICQDIPSEGIEEREVAFSTTGRHTVKTTTTGCNP